MPAPVMSGTSGSRVRSQSRGVSWSDQMAAEASGDVSPSQQPQLHTIWRPEEDSDARMRPEFIYLTRRVPPIPLAPESEWARTDLEWPVVAKAKIDLAHAQAVRQILAANLAAFVACPTGVEQWVYEPQDCFDGQETTAKTEGNMAEAAVTWVCGGELELALTALQDFFPADPK
eukprot:3358787-Amphidinium_carterae.1